MKISNNMYLITSLSRVFFFCFFYQELLVFFSFLIISAININNHLLYLRYQIGYRYGKTLVPLTKIDKDSMKLPTERCLSLLCFTSNENVSADDRIKNHVRKSQLE